MTTHTAGLSLARLTPVQRMIALRIEELQQKLEEGQCPVPVALATLCGLGEETFDLVLQRYRELVGSAVDDGPTPRPLERHEALVDAAARLLPELGERFPPEVVDRIAESLPVFVTGDLAHLAGYMSGVRRAAGVDKATNRKERRSAERLATKILRPEGLSLSAIKGAAGKGPEVRPLRSGHIDPSDLTDPRD